MSPQRIDMAANRPFQASTREHKIAQELWDKVSGVDSAVVYVFANTMGSSRDPDDAVVFIPDLPFEPLSVEARSTGKYTDRINKMQSSSATGSLDTSEPLCGACHNALAYCLEASDPSKARMRVNGSVPISVVHHVDLVSLSSSARAGCFLCKELSSRLLRFLPKNVDPETIQLEVCWPSSKTDEGHSALHFVFTQPRKVRNPWNYTTYYQVQAWNDEEFSSCFNAPGAEHGDFEPFTGSPASRKLAHYWYNACVHNADGKHSECNERREGWLPTRLLNVEKAKRGSLLQLVTCNKNPAAFAPHDGYVTLSYCWGAGGEQKLPLLTSANLKQREEFGLPITELPKTLKEAIDVASWFGSKYDSRTVLHTLIPRLVKWLWIDCLCILQDSTTDWVKEAEAMSKTYRNALFNISADTSDNAFEGCFSTRDPTSLRTWQLGAPHNGRKWWMTPDKRYVFEWIRSTPAFSRAWIYRERQLSRRVLHFTSKEMIWECCGTSYASETYPGGAPFSASFGGDAKYQFINMFDGNRQWDPSSQSSVHRTWDDLCGKFSQKRLTKPTDMPVVISSLAQDFANLLPGDEYAAGLWRFTLPGSLLWKTNSLVGAVQGTDQHQPAIAPSWSWLSPSVPVTLRSTWPGLPVLRVNSIDMRPELMLHDPRRVPSLTVTGFLRRLRVEVLRNRVDLGKTVFHLSLYDAERRALGISWSDEDGDSVLLQPDNYFASKEVTFHCLFVAGLRLQPGHSIQGLLLESAGGNTGSGLEKYRRVGTIEFQHDMALKVRYQVRFGRSPGKEDWQAFGREIDESRRTSKAGEDNKWRETNIDPSRVDPFELYRWDRVKEPSWLKRLKPHRVMLV